MNTKSTKRNPVEQNPMSSRKTKNDIRLTGALQSQLLDYRKRVWITKIAEAVAVALCCLLIAWIAVFAFDRLFDTPSWMRGGTLALVIAGLALIPAGLYRWVYRRRTLPQVARLICRKLPGVGDRLLGVIDLVEDKEEQARSPVLCKAAVDQVDTEARGWDLKKGLPSTRNSMLWKQAAVLGGLVILGCVLAPAAVRSAWTRLASPWGDAPRYTFAALGDVDNEKIVPHGEPFSSTVPLAEDSRWRPDSGTMLVNNQVPLVAELTEGAYQFEVPAQIEPTKLKLKIGDARKSITVKPTLRPELETAMADITLPAYLEREGVREQDVRGGAVSLVKGSQVVFRAKVNRELDSAKVNGSTCTPDGDCFKSNLSVITDNKDFEFAWTDNLTLDGKEPFKISVTAADDQVPNVACTGMRRQMVVLVSEQLSFENSGPRRFRY